jgi:translation initiation factor IF-3
LVIAKLLSPDDRRLRLKTVRVVDNEGQQVGVLPIENAFALAKEAGLDLVMVAENAEPPVCRVLDFGKMLYEHKRKQKDQKKHHHTQKLKEIKFHINIDEHDYQYKLGHAKEFLDKGFKVKVTLVFRGREAAHREIGFEIVDRVIKDLDKIGHADGRPAATGRLISVLLSPLAHR